MLSQIRRRRFSVSEVSKPRGNQMMITRRIYLTLLIFCCATSLQAQFYSLETENLRLLYYDKGHEYVVPHLARCFENAYRFHNQTFNYTPSDKITVLLDDFGDFASGGAGTIPHNTISVGISPFNYTFETMTANERMNTIMNHELAHIATLDQAGGREKFFRRLFLGKGYPTSDNPLSILYLYLTSPRWGSPRWYTEGIAVFMETWMAGGLGRALGAYDEMVFRTMVRDSSYFYDIVGLESEGTKVDFQVGANSYLYGTRFMSYLAYAYGPDKLIEWTSRPSNSKAHFAAQFKNVYKNSIKDEWSKWIAWERSWQQANLDSIRTAPVTAYRSVTRQPLGSVSRMYVDPDGQTVYAAIRYPGQFAHIAEIDLSSGSLKKIKDIKGAGLFYVTSLAFDPQARTLFYTTDNNGWRDIHATDLTSGKSRLLLRDARVGDLAFNLDDKSLWGVRHFNGISTLVRIPHPYREWNQVYSFPYGKDIYDIDVSPDGKTVTSALVEIDGSQKLIKMDTQNLLAGETSFEEIFDFDISIPANFVFSPDGRYLFGSSYYSGVSNIYRYDFVEQDMDILSNCETGFFRPTVVDDDSLLILRYMRGGFVPTLIAIEPLETVNAARFLGTAIVKKNPELRDWTLGSPAEIDIDALTISKDRYNTLSQVTLTSAIPVVEGYKDFAAVGMRLDFSEPLSLSRFDLTGSYSPDRSLPGDERFHARFNLHHWNWQLSATYNGADFYDLFGPTKRSRKGYSVGMKYRKTLMYDEPKALRLNFGVAGYGNLERLPDFQNVAATFEELLTGHVSLDYEFVRKSLGAVDEEAGLKWRLATDPNYVNSKLFPFLRGDLDVGALLPLNHSSVWLRTSAGSAFGDRDDPFANFFFGGFGNNWVDHLSEKRYHEFYSFPGVELNAIGGRNYGKAMVEWLLPPVRFRRAGFPSLYFNWTRIALFSSGLATDLDSASARQTFFNVGGQIDFRLVLFSKLHSTISFGYAAAIEAGQAAEDASTEFMFSLKIL